MFYKKGVSKICKVHMKTPVLDTLFNKLRGLSHATLLEEKASIQVFSDEFCEIFKTSFLRNTSRPLLQTTHALKTFKHYLPHVFYFLTLFSTLFSALYDILIYFSDIYQYLWYISLLSMISLNLGSKMSYFGVSGSNFEKLFSCLKPAPPICLIAKFSGNIKTFKFGVKFWGPIWVILD